MVNDIPENKPKAKRKPAAETADIELDINFELIERRRTVRSIPCPEAIECNDEESWSTWNELMSRPVELDAKAAMTKIRQLLRKEPRAGDET